MSEPLFRVIPWNSAASFLPSDLDRDKKIYPKEFNKALKTG